MDALQEVPEVARAAEETGFAGMWANDTKHNPFVTLALAAPSTSRLELGTGVAVAFARSPMVTAQTA
ncbi:MAG: LLM class flavin-dependent oxidoreductase, partial [Bacillati bacterium ANGP1]